MQDNVVGKLMRTKKSFLTYFFPMVPFYTLWKDQKTFGFLILSEGINKKEHWEDMVDETIQTNKTFGHL